MRGRIREPREVVEDIPTPTYGWVTVLLVWLFVLAGVTAVGGFAVGYESVDVEERGAGLGVIAGALSALLIATPLLVLAGLLYLLREIAISAARIDGWAEANFEIDRLTDEAGGVELTDETAHRS